MMAATLRQPAVAGYFYPGKKDDLLREVTQYTSVAGKKIRALGCVVPHAGYIYSGHVAGAVFARLELPRRFIILCPNHTGRGEPLAVMSEGSWLTPLGEVGIDRELATQLKQNFKLLAEDAGAHLGEHALEVQLPFLQHLVREFTFVPITVGVGNYPVLAALGEAMATTLAGVQEPVLIVASSDMNHYESDARTRVKDRKAIDQLLAIDPRGLYDVVVNEDISMCGFGPAVAMLTATKRRGAKAAELIKYATSGDISGDRDKVVGYAGIVVS